MAAPAAGGEAGGGERQRGGIIVLIGPTRNGKSTLGNLLANGPDEDAAPVFAEGDGSESETRACKAVRVTDEDGREHVVLDTPGFGDTKGEDHVLQLHVVESLRELAKRDFSISLFVMVVKLDNGLGQEYKELIKMYRRLLGKLFEDNLQIVFTNCAEHGLVRRQKRAERRAQAGPADAMEKVRLETCKLLGVRETQVPLMYVDALPDPDEAEDVKRAEDLRRNLLQKAAAAELRVLEGDPFALLPKVPSWVQEDEAAAATLRGRLEGFLRAITAKEARGQELALERERVAERVYQLEREIGQVRMWLHEYDTPLKEQVFFRRDYSISSTAWLPFSRTEKTFTIRAHYPISRARVSAGSTVKVSSDGMSVTVAAKSGVLWSSGFVSVALFTGYQNIYGKKIAEAAATHNSLQDECLARKEELKGLEQQLAHTMHHKGNLDERFQQERRQLLDLSKSELEFDAFRARCIVSGALLPSFRFD